MVSGSGWTAGYVPLLDGFVLGRGDHEQPHPGSPTGRDRRTTPSGRPAAVEPQPEKASQTKWWLAIGAIVVVLAVLAYLAIRGLGGILGTGPAPGSNPTQSVCPKQVATTVSPKAAPNDGRVHGGALSYPMLGSPWSAPAPEDRVPFGRDVLSQIVTIEPNYNNEGSSWVASVVSGVKPVAGDGFFSPERGSPRSLSSASWAPSTTTPRCCATTR